MTNKTRKIGKNMAKCFNWCCC